MAVAYLYMEQYEIAVDTLKQILFHHKHLTEALLVTGWILTSKLQADCFSSGADRRGRLAPARESMCHESIQENLEDAANCLRLLKRKDFYEELSQPCSSKSLESYLSPAELEEIDSDFCRVS